MKSLLVEANEYKTDNKKHTDTMVSSTYLNERFAQLSSEDYTGNDNLEQNCRLNNKEVRTKEPESSQDVTCVIKCTTGDLFDQKVTKLRIISKHAGVESNQDLLTGRTGK